MGFVDRRIITMAVYCFANLLNYMDRYTLAGVLADVQTFYKISDSQAGLMQTLFTVAYMIFAPLYGYLGDRYSRRLLVAICVFISSASTLAGSFMPDFWPFVGTRLLLGLGAAGLITVGPTVISDIYAKSMRSRMLALICFAIPVGSGLGYIVGSEAAALGSEWFWALRATPVLGLICFICMFFTIDPVRGRADGIINMENTSWWADVKYLLGNPTYILTTCGVTAVNFLAGSLTWWGAKYITMGKKLQQDPENQSPTSSVSFIFGVIAMLAGIIGVILGVVLSQKLRPRFPRADPLICGIGLLISAPLILSGLLMAETDTTVAFVLIFLGQILLNMNWSISTDIKMYVVVPTRRATAAALQIFVGKALGDATSPYLIGLISDMLKPVLSPSGDFESLTSLSIVANSTVPNHESLMIDFKALQYASYIAIVFEALGGLFFVASALFLMQDKAKVDKVISDSCEDNEERQNLNQQELTDLSPSSVESRRNGSLNVPT